MDKGVDCKTKGRSGQENGCIHLSNESYWIRIQLKIERIEMSSGESHNDNREMKKKEGCDFEGKTCQERI